MQNFTGPAVPDSCEQGITPACLQTLYGIPATLATESSNSLGVSGFNNEFAQEADLYNFLVEFRPDLSPSTTFSLQSIDGGENLQGPGNNGSEANFDIQYTVGVASGVPTTFISAGEEKQDDLDQYLDMVHFLLDESNPPHVLTTSYGFPDETLISTKLAQ